MFTGDTSEIISIAPGNLEFHITWFRFQSGTGGLEIFQSILCACDSFESYHRFLFLSRFSKAQECRLFTHLPPPPPRHVHIHKINVIVPKLLFLAALCQGGTGVYIHSMQ